MSKNGIVIAAAGEGSRFKLGNSSALPKAVCIIDGMPMIHWLLLEASRLNVSKVHVLANQNIPIVAETVRSLLSSQNYGFTIKPRIHLASPNIGLRDNILQYAEPVKNLILMLGSEIYDSRSPILDCLLEVSKHFGKSVIGVYNCDPKKHLQILAIEAEVNFQNKGYFETDKFVQGRYVFRDFWNPGRSADFTHYVNESIAENLIIGLGNNYLPISIRSYADYKGLKGNQ